MSLKKIVLLASLALAAQVHAQSTGTLVSVPAVGEVKHANDEATVTFMVEEQDKDKSAAAARVNQKMKQGTEIVRAHDPQAALKTLGYSTYPVYPEERPLPNGMPSGKPRVATSWRVAQSLEVKTTNLAGLPKMASAAQKLLALNGIEFGLSPATAKSLDEQRIAVTYRNLNERIAVIANTMGRKVSESTLESVDFGLPNQSEYGRAEAVRFSGNSERTGAEPSFEPGETTLQMGIIGKVRFK